MGFKMFRENKDLRKCTVCSVFKREIIFQGLAEEHISMSEHFLNSDNVLSTYFSIWKINPNFERMYQKQASGVKAAEGLEQSSPKPSLFPPGARKASTYHHSAQDAHQKSIQGHHGLAGLFASWLWQDNAHFQLQP